MQVYYAGDVRVGEDGVLLRFAGVGGGFEGLWVRAFGGWRAFWSGVDRFELGEQPVPGSKGHVAVEAV